MKVVQVTLGHSALAVTADLYTSALAELAKAAAEATAAIVSRRSGAGAAPGGTPEEHHRGLSAAGGEPTS